MAHTCPRRFELFQQKVPAGVTDPDSFEPKHGLTGQSLGCTYCGSLPPDAFMEAVRAGAQVGPTDKSYKVYLKPVAGGESKFYTPHLSPEQSREFWDLWQQGRVNWGYPGYPYARIYLPGLVLDKGKEE